MSFNIDEIKALGRQQREREGFYPEFARAVAEGVDGFKITFASEAEAQNFATALNAAKKKGGVNDLLITKSNVDGNDVTVSGITDSNAFVAELRESSFDNFLTKPALEQQLARKDLAARRTYATAVNAATAGIPVAGYALNGLGRGLAFANRYLGWIPLAGFALRTGARACLDSSAEILEHGASFFDLLDRFKDSGKKQANELRDISSRLGTESRAHRFLNEITDGAALVAGSLVSAVSIATNLVADGAYRFSRAVEGNGTSITRKVAASALKVVSAPFRVPAIVGDWLVSSAKHSLPKASSGVSNFFQKTLRIPQSKVNAGNLSALTVPKAATSQDSIFNIKEAFKLFSNLRFDKEIGGAFYAKIGEISHVTGPVKVYVDFACKELKVKGLDGVYQDLASSKLSADSKFFDKVQNLINADKASASTDKVTRQKLQDQEPLARLSSALKIVAGQNVVVVGSNNKPAIAYKDGKNLIVDEDGLKSATFSIKSGSVTLNCEKGQLSVVKHGVVIGGEDLRKSPDFFNILKDIEAKKGEFKGEMNKPSSSTRVVVATSLKTLEKGRVIASL